MSEQTSTESAPVEAPVESPPPAPQPEREESDPRAKLAQIASELMRSHNRRLVIEYMRLRRAIA